MWRLLVSDVAILINLFNDNRAYKLDVTSTVFLSLTKVKGGGGKLKGQGVAYMVTASYLLFSLLSLLWALVAEALEVRQFSAGDETSKDLPEPPLVFLRGTHHMVYDLPHVPFTLHVGYLQIPQLLL